MAETTTGSRPTPTGCSACAASTTSCCSTAAARSGSWRAARSTPTARLGPRPHPDRAARPELRIFRDEVVACAGTGTMVDVRSPAEFTGELLAPAHLPQEQPHVAGHIPGARNIPWSKAANDDGISSSRSTNSVRSTRAQACPPAPGGHLLPDRGAVSAHLVRAHRTAGFPTCATTTARGPSTAAWSTCPSSSAERRRGRRLWACRSSPTAAAVRRSGTHAVRRARRLQVLGEVDDLVHIG